MPEEPQQESVKFIVTRRGLQPMRHLRFALRRAIPGARVRGTGFRSVLALEAGGESAELAKLIWRECSDSIGHVTTVFFTVESKEQPIEDAAVQIGAAQISSEESFSFRLHKRGAHGLAKETSRIEAEIGAAISAVLEMKHHKKPRVDLNDPDVTVVAEILGPMAWVGIARKSWRD